MKCSLRSCLSLPIVSWLPFPHCLHQHLRVHPCHQQQPVSSASRGPCSPVTAIWLLQHSESHSWDYDSKSPGHSSQYPCTVPWFLVSDFLCGLASFSFYRQRFPDGQKKGLLEGPDSHPPSTEKQSLLKSTWQMSKQANMFVFLQCQNLLNNNKFTTYFYWL